MPQHTITEPRPRGGIPRLQPQSSIALLSYGFRPFFLGAGLWATVAMVLWIGLVSGLWQFANAYGAVAWHAHEFLFGYVSAVLTGFLLTAIPNWTGRLPLQGSPLLALCLLWAAGRVAMLATDQIGVVAAAAVDCAYLPTLAAVILREIIVGRNWRNLKVTILVVLLALANVLFQVEVLVRRAPDYGLRLGTAAIVGLIMLVGGRITPSFTHNWLTRAGSAKLPAPLDRFDMTAIAVAGGALLSWIAAPGWRGTAVLPPRSPRRLALGAGLASGPGANRSCLFCMSVTPSCRWAPWRWAPRSFGQRSSLRPQRCMPGQRVRWAR